MGDYISSRHEFLSWPLAQTARDSSAESESFYVRRFGAECSDLNVDYRVERSKLITRLLQACVRNMQGEPFLTSDIMAWSLKRRLQALLGVGFTTHGRHLQFQSICSDDTCAQILELEVDLLAFCEPENESIMTCQPSTDTVLELRLPTSVDQALWQNQTFSENNEALFSSLATTLVMSINGVAPQPDWQVPPAWLDSIAQSLESHDNMMTIQIDSACPACGVNISVGFDLEAQLLSLLANQKNTLLQHIHQLASVYHWTEEDILALPANRRQYYIERIEEDALA
jgi:hypothetical protein